MHTQHLSQPGDKAEEAPTSTEQARHHDALHTALMDALQDAVIVTDATGIIVYCNGRVEDIFGWKPHELLRHPFLGTLTGLNTRSNAERTMALLRTEAKWSGSFQARRRDGTCFQALFTAAPVRNAEGEIINYVAIVHPPAGSPALESMLSSVQARWQSLMQHIPARILMLNSQGTVLYSNRKPTDGSQSESEIGRPVEEALPYAAAERTIRALPAVFERQEMVSYEIVTESSADGVQAFQHVLAPVVDRDYVSAAILIAVDISRHVRASQALAERELRLRSVFGAAPVGIGLLKERILLDVNNRFCEMVGRSRIELIGKSTRSLYTSEEEYLAVGHAITHQTRDRGTATIETRWSRKDASIADVLLNIAPLNPEAPSDGLILTALDISARRRAEAALQESQRLYRTLLSNLPGMACRYRVGPDRSMEFVSDGCLELTGYPPHALIADGTLYINRVHPDDRPALWPQVQSALQRQSAFTLTYRIETLHGEQKWVWEQGRGIYDAAGQPTAIESFIIDVTETKRAQDTIRASEERLRQIVLNMPVMLTAVDASRTYVVWNKECERVTGYTADEMIHNPDALALLYPDPEYRAWVVSEANRQQYDFRDLELEMVCKDGSRRIVNWCNQSRRYPIPGWESWGVGIDITESRQAERLLSEQATLLQYVSDAIIVLDPGFIIQGWNETAEHLFGWPKDEAIGRPMESISPMWFGDRIPDDISAEFPRQDIAQATGQLLEHGVWRGEATMRHRDGHPVNLLATATLMFDQANNPSGVFVLLHDITERKQAEIALRESEERYRRLAEVSPDGIFVHQEGRIVFANQAGARLLGAASPEALLGKSVYDFVRPEIYPQIQTRIADTLAGRDVGLGLIEVHRLDGQTILLETTTTALAWEGRPAIQTSARQARAETAS